MQVKRFRGGRPLLLLHGAGGSWRSWEPLSRRLAARRLLVVPDLPGFGDSPPEGAPNFRSLATRSTPSWSARAFRASRRSATPSAASWC